MSKKHRHDCPKWMELVTDDEQKHIDALDRRIDRVQAEAKLLRKQRRQLTARIYNRIRNKSLRKRQF